MASPNTKGALVRSLSDVVARLTGRPGESAALTAPVRSPAVQRMGNADQWAKQDGFDPPSSYFGSGRPLAPVAPPGSTTGRAFDFPPYANLNYLPRSESGENAIDFATLRMLADPTHGGLDLLRLAIETRKDQMSAQRWQIRGQEKDDDGGDDAREIEQLLRKPDGIHTFRQWMRMLLEDHFVIDAVSLYFDFSDTKRPRFEPVDASTFKLLITAKDGRTPMPPLPAYQQVIKGMVAQNYTIGEVGYYAYNKRTNRIYGCSRVEQILATVNIALNRQLSQLAYFTSGTIPDGFMEAPKTWPKEEIERWSEYFNSVLEGQVGKRRQIQWVPEGAKYVPTKTEVLKDSFDEWLARLICYCFSLPVQSLVKETNRATAQVNKQAAQEEGLEPVKLWFADVMDDILIRVGLDDLRFQWADEEIVDPETKAKVANMYFGGPTGNAKKIMTLAEAREFVNLPPPTAEQLKELQPPEPAPVVADGSQNGGEPNANGNGNGSHAPGPNAANGNGKKKGDEGTTAKTAGVRTFGYDRLQALQRAQRESRDNTTKRIDELGARLQATIEKVHTAVDAIAARPDASPPTVNVHAAAAPPAPEVKVDITVPPAPAVVIPAPVINAPVHVDVHLPPRTEKGPVTMHAERQGEKLIVTEVRDSTASAPDTKEKPNEG